MSEMSSLELVVILTGTHILKGYTLFHRSFGCLLEITLVEQDTNISYKSEKTKLHSLLVKVKSAAKPPYGRQVFFIAYTLKIN